MHSAHEASLLKYSERLCWKIYFSAKALIDYSLWPDCPINGMIEPGLAGLLCLFNRREIPFSCVTARMPVVCEGIIDDRRCCIIYKVQSIC